MGSPWKWSRKRVKLKTSQTLDQVKVIAHQTVRVNLKTSLRAGLDQRLHKILPVHIRFEDLPLAVGPAHHMVYGPRIFDSELARHGD